MIVGKIVKIVVQMVISQWGGVGGESRDTSLVVVLEGVGVVVHY